MTNVTYIVRALDQFDATFKKFNRDSRGMAKSLDNLKMKQKQLSETSLRLKGDMIDAFAIFKGLQGLINPAIEFESKLADLNKVANLTPSALKDMSNGIKDLSKTIPETTSGLTDIAAAGARLGIKGRENLLSFTKDVAQASVAFGMSADTTGQAFATLSNILDIPVTKISTLSNRINLLGNNLAATEEGIIEVTLRSGAMGKAIGMSADTIATMSGTILAMGVRQDVAGTSLANFYNKVQLLAVGQAPKAALRALHSIGMSSKGLAKALKEDANGAITGLINKLGHLSSGKQAAVLNQLFDTYTARQIQKMTGNLDGFNKAMKLSNMDAAGSVVSEFQTRSKTAAAQIQLLKNKLNLLLIDLGEKLLPTLKDAVSTFSYLTLSLIAFVKENPNLVKWVVLGTGALLAFRVASIASAYGITLLKGAFLAARIAALAFNTAFAFSPIGAIILGVTALIALVVTLYNKWTLFKDMLKDTFVGKGIEMISKFIGVSDDVKKEGKGEATVKLEHTITDKTPNKTHSVNSNMSSSNLNLGYVNNVD